MGDFCYPFASCHSCMFWGFGKANHHVLLPHTGLRGLLEPQRPETKTHEENNIITSATAACKLSRSDEIIDINASSFNQPTKQTKQTIQQRITHSPHSFILPFQVPTFFFWAHEDMPLPDNHVLSMVEEGAKRTAGNTETPLNGDFLQGQRLDESYYCGEG